MNSRKQNSCGRAPRLGTKKKRSITGKETEQEKQAFRTEENRIHTAKSSFDPRAEPASCQLCSFYQPSFRYRKCLYSKCPYGKKEEIFRRNPLGRKQFGKKGE